MVITLFREDEDLHDFVTVKGPPFPYDRKGALYTEGARRIYCVVSGWVRTYRLNPRMPKGAHLEFYGPGEFFGLLGDQVDFTECAEAVSKCEVLMWAPAEFRQMLLAKPGGFTALARIALRREMALRKRLEWFDYGVFLRPRVALALIEASKMGVKIAPGVVRLEPAPTHELLAAMCSTKREIVTANHNYFRKRGFLSLNGRKFLDIHVGRLEAFVNECRLGRSTDGSRKAVA